ncbi:hypothetical protein [Rummeliibacillus sp. POC4]|uniref:hypothetical protein n=1 Tax=Rummeliibacillus sp. POC4 TaxID=2305899 RepID=UPI000E65F7ED|nr:hypothetical protein [Rummeliibacillus sp. POC4]RIJ64381.1 hypothetical protein D1606_10670 [Rummeliibacillus sp. POC4]
MDMAKGKSLLIAGLAAGAYAYFRKKENRDKAVEAFNSTKSKVNSLLDKSSDSSVSVVKDSFNTTTADGYANDHHTYNDDDTKMISEGSATAIHYENEEQHEFLNGIKPPKDLN